LGLFNFSKDQRGKVHSIRKRTLKMILEASKSSYPDEFGAFLRAEKGVIRELILLPGTVSGHSHASFKMYMLPIDFTIVGTVHSHPSGACHPSEGRPRALQEVRLGAHHRLHAVRQEQLGRL